MNATKIITRPASLAEVAAQSDSLESFGMNLRDWQHEIQRGGMCNRPAFSRCIREAPPRCAGRFVGGDVADAYLAAYAEWLADRAGIDRPAWAGDAQRVSADPWFATPLRGRLLAITPASFRQRNLFTIPEPVFRPAAGRPKLSTAHKREKARARQKAYRERIRALVKKARSLEASAFYPRDVNQ